MRNLKRALSLALASVMVLGMMVVGTSASYADVADTDNVEAIEVAKAAGIMVGDDKGNFNPDQKVTRNEMAVVMANLLGLKVANYEGTKLPFTDVPSWAKNYVAACYTNGIVSGTSATTYGGNDNVTAAQASLMVMKALGYFQNSGDFGDDWQLATVKQASKIDLTNGIDTAANAALTRNDVAQLVLNGLEADVVDFTGVYGTDIKTADGTTIQIGYVSKYDAERETALDYTTANLGGDPEDTTLQLVEKLYKDDMTKDTANKDAFGRPATKWSYKNDTVGTYADKADKVYVGGVKQKDLYKDLDLSAATDDFDQYVDSTTASSFPVISSTASTMIGGNGQLVEVYFDKTTAANRRIVITNYYVGEVADVDTNSKDERIVKVDGLNYVTEAFAEDDVVIYTVADGAIKSMVLGEKLTGKITKLVGTSTVYIDGTKYTLSACADAEDYGVTAKDDVEFYLDPNGYTYACKNCEEETGEANILKTPKQPVLCPGSFASAKAVAHIMTQKFVMYSPLYRLEQEFNREGLKLSRQTMTNWMLNTSDTWLRPIYDVLHRELCKEPVLHGDETTLQVLKESGKAATSKSYMWLYRTSGCAKSPIVLYEYQPSRKAAHAEEFLKGFSGWFHADGYQGYHKLPENIRVVGCWAHARRKFDEALQTLPKENRKGSLAATGECYCTRLFQLEESFAELTPEERYAKRLEQEKPVLDALLAWANETISKTAPKSALGKALYYLMEQWPYLVRYLEDGRLELSNNRAERSIKPFVMGRKNWLFANTPAGAQSSAVIYSLIETAKENGLDPYRYLLWVLRNAPAMSQTNEAWAEQLLPASAPQECRIPKE